MNDLISWLRQQLDADEQVVLRGDAASWYDMDGMDQAAVDHACHFDPKYQLRQVAAQRSILNLCAAAMAAGEVKPGTTWNDDAAGAEVAEATIRLLGEVYADRPGYREEWRP